ncbi:hypothetical protein SUGI_0966080 [Cryptomeria japonica]|nr:hypothetical protein SUGI_0966080 [Cryptomeria japonica]
MESYPKIVSNTNPRHMHPLILCEDLSPYKCNGCKEYGANIGYRCNFCPHFTLHQVCGAYPDTFVHPFYPAQEFKFRKKTCFRHDCDACGEALKGFVYESPRPDSMRPLRLHPLCVALPTTLDYGGHEDHPVQLIMETGGTFVCSRCNESKSGWSYRCDEMACRLRVDLMCVKVDINGLPEHGIATMKYGSWLVGKCCCT